MSVDRKEIDLIIRAALQGGKTLEGVSKSITDIEKALDAQTAAAKRGESSIDQLKATLESLKRTQDQLKDQAGLIGQFQRLSDQIEKTAERASKAAKTYSDYKDKLDAAGKATEYQAARLIKLASAAERGEATLTRQRADQEALTVTLREAGIEVGNLAAAETRAREAAAQLGVSINRTQQAISTYSDDVRIARAEQRKLADDQAFEQKLQDAARLNQAGEYIRFWTDSLNKADLAEQQLQVNTALRKTADEAVAAARGYKTLGTAAKTLSGSSSGLREVIQGIVDPSTQARTTLGGIEQQVRQVGDAVAATKGPIENYRAQVTQLAAAQRSISQQAGMVDAFVRQTAALQQARTEFVSARAEVLQYADALRNSTGQNDQLQASLRNAQVTLAAAQRNLAAQLSTTRELRNAMRAAGLSTSDLAGTQSRLTATAQASTAAMKNLETAHKKYGEATRAGGEAHDMFTSSGRTTLSFLQRIRGEVLSMVAAYAGLYGAINGATQVVDAFNAKQAIQSQLALTVGNDNKKIADEYEYIRQQADRVGVAFEAAAKGYAKFSAAATLAGSDSKEIKYIFETFMEVGRVAGLTTENLDGVFKALEQIISKGSIQAEELRGQLGDRLFGAFQVAAQALKGTYPDLDKALKEGKVSATELLAIAEKYKEIVGERLPQATQSLAANQARLNTELFFFKNLIAEKGFGDEFDKLVKTLTEFFRSNDGEQFAQMLSDRLGTLVKVLRVIVENIELVKTALTIAFGLYASKLVLGLGASAADTATKFMALRGAMGAVDGTRATLMRGFMALSAFFVGWEIGTLLSEKFTSVKLAGIALVVGLDILWTRMKYGAAIIWSELPNIFMDALSAVGNVATKGLRTILQVFSAAARGIGKNDLADSIDKALKAIEFRTDRIGSASGRLTQQMEADLARIRQIGDEMASEAMNPGATTARATGVATDKPDPSKKKAKVDEKELARRKRLKEQIEAEIAAIDAKIERQEKDSLDSRLAAIDDTYFKLIRKIKALGGKEAEAFASDLSDKVSMLKTQETSKFNAALLKEQTLLQTKLEQIDAQAGRHTKTDIDKRLAAVRLAHEDTYRDIEAYRAKLAANGRSTEPADLMKGRLDAGILAIQNLERQKYFEDSINTVLEERKAKLDTIAVQEKVGLISQVQARERAAQVITETQPKIEAITAEGLKYVEQMILSAEATGSNTAALETLRAKLIEARESAKGMKVEFLSAQQVNEMLANGATNAFGKMAEAIGGAIRGVNTWRDAINATRSAFLNFAADFMMEIGKMILKQALLNSLREMTAGAGGFGAVISTAVNALLKHDGGVIGAPGSSMRTAPASWFMNAPRYHGGGIPGLASDEYPAILKKNEEVLTQNDPRNVLNGGLSQTAAGQGVKIINMIDSGSVVSEGLSTQSGERAIFNFIRANRTGLKQILA